MFVQLAFILFTLLSMLLYDCDDKVLHSIHLFVLLYLRFTQNQKAMETYFSLHYVSSYSHSSHDSNYYQCTFRTDLL